MADENFLGTTFTFNEPRKLPQHLNHLNASEERRLPPRDYIKLHGYAMLINGVIAASEKGLDKLRISSLNAMNKLVQVAFNNIENPSETAYNASPSFISIIALSHDAYNAVKDGEVTRADQLDYRNAVEGSNSLEVYALESEPHYRNADYEAEYRERAARRAADDERIRKARTQAGLPDNFRSFIK